MLKLCMPTRLISPICRLYSDLPIVMNYTKFNTYEIVHPKSPVIVLHELFLSNDNWYHIGVALSKNGPRSVYTVDARNHGNSAHTPTHSLLEMTDDITEFMENFHIHQIVAMGHGMGGLTMMAMAMLNPRHVERLIIVDVSPIALPAVMSKGPQLLNAMIETKIPKKITLYHGRRLMRPIINEILRDIGVTNFILANLRKEINGEFSWTVNCHALRNSWKDLEHTFAQITKFLPYKGPTLLLASKHSNIVDPSDAPQIRTLFPNIDIKWLDTGHMMHFTQPEEFVKIVLQFLDKKF